MSCADGAATEAVRENYRRACGSGMPAHAPGTDIVYELLEEDR